MEDDYVEPKKEISRYRFAINFILFALMGSGANWILPTALFQEIPYLIDRSPEGLCIATYMNVATAGGIVFCMAYVTLNNYGYVVPYKYAVPFLLVLSCVGTFFAAAVYNIIIFKVSFMLFVSCLIGGIVGSLANVIMNPFMTRYENDYISAARSGGSGGQLLVALLALVQQPGAHSKFSPAVFLIVFGILFIPPIFAWYHITTHRIGERDGWNEDSLRQSLRVSLGAAGKLNKDTLDEVLHTHALPQDVPLLAPNGRPLSMLQLTPIIHKEPARNPMLAVEEGVEEREQAPEQKRVTVADTPASVPLPRWLLSIIAPINSVRVACSSWFHQYVIHGFLIGKCIPAKYIEENPWLPRALPYMLTVGWVNFNTWGMLSAVTPFAVYNAADGADIASEYLAYAYEIAAFTLMLGDLSTTEFKLPFDVFVPLFTLLTFVIYLAAFGAVAGDTTPVTPTIMVAVFCLGRFIEAHLITSTYRTIATDFDVLTREHASRGVGLTDQISTVMGAIVSTILVTQLVDTSTDDYSNGYYYHHKGC